MKTLMTHAQSAAESTSIVFELQVTTFLKDDTALHNEVKTTRL